MTEAPGRGQFLNMAALFEGGLAVVAFALGWLVGVDPLATLHWSPEALAWGALAAGPIFAAFLVMYRFPVGPFGTIRRFLVEFLGPYLAVCRWYDLLALALIAGISEELLFRGVLQPWLSGWGHLTGVIGANLIFGLAHLVTPTYGVIAALIGLYLSWVMEAAGSPNLLAPIVTHAVYDWLAFLVVLRTYRIGPDAEFPPTGPDSL